MMDVKTVYAWKYIIYIMIWVRRRTSKESGWGKREQDECTVSVSILSCTLAVWNIDWEAERRGRQLRAQKGEKRTGILLLKVDVSRLLMGVSLACMSVLCERHLLLSDSWTCMTLASTLDKALVLYDAGLNPGQSSASFCGRTKARWNGKIDSTRWVRSFFWGSKNQQKLADPGDQWGRKVERKKKRKSGCLICTKGLTGYVCRSTVPVYQRRQQPHTPRLAWLYNFLVTKEHLYAHCPNTKLAHVSVFHARLHWFAFYSLTKQT